ncbi:unnamed protein product [Rotaria magnacalcarata]|uniref:Endonuclease/exonuclease/phosphatase domain-containing protein n=1 Tax=Rotaria magnacalcarata TaxID=392030 RepID=A0A820FKD4_9BILA|nr:unnamed protein product [Rotaria magnacalcarata]
MDLSRQATLPYSTLETNTKEEVLLVKLNGKPFNISIIQSYAPTTDHNEEAITKFYEDLDLAYKQCKSQNIVNVMGDFNAKVGNERIGSTVGPFGLGTVLSSKAFPGADCDSDHAPVISDIPVKPKIVKTTAKNMMLQVHLLKNNLNIKENFRIEVQNRFEALTEINEFTETEILWEQLKSTITASAEKVLPKAQPNKKTEWINNGILELMEQR